ncbi:MAG TPA: GspH/FimT family pseudopilin [Tahibacter sp.]|nr:GspH/FimT family pseudopilin [Tahibacter sp.]
MHSRTGRPAAGASHASGFTLIELVVTLAVVAVLAVLALPSFTSTLGQSRMTAAANNLVAALNLARSEAIGRARAVSVCPSADGARCGGNDWNTGWIAYVDGGVAGRFDGDDVALRAWSGLKSGDSVAATRAGVTFGATGMADAAVEFVARPDRCKADQQRRVSLLAFGRVSSRREACS